MQHLIITLLRRCREPAACEPSWRDQVHHCFERPTCLVSGRLLLLAMPLLRHPSCILQLSRRLLIHTPNCLCGLCSHPLQGPTHRAL